MTAPRLANILLIIIVVLMIVLIALQVYVIMDDDKPTIRPRLAPTQRSPLYERFHRPEAMKIERML